MRLLHATPILIGLAVSSCSGDTYQGTSQETTETAEFASPAETTALDALLTTYVEDYNRHDAAAVAAAYTDDAVALFADGTVSMGKDAITAAVEKAMTLSPTLDVTRDDVKMFEHMAVARGTYHVDATPAGAEAISLTGNYLTTFALGDDGWKIALLITNYNAPPTVSLPVGGTPGETPGEPPEEKGQMADLISAYETHFNLGHASMVADLYTDDAVAAFANLPRAEGRDAIESALAERIAAGASKITIHDVGTTDLAEGWKLDGGWYDVAASTNEGTTSQIGGYMILCRQMDDGSWKIQWAVSNGQPS